MCERVWKNDQSKVYLWIRNEAFDTLPQQSARTSSIPGNVVFRVFCVALKCIDDSEWWWAICGPSRPDLDLWSKIMQKTMKKIMKNRSEAIKTCPDALESSWKVYSD